MAPRAGAATEQQEAVTVIAVLVRCLFSSPGDRPFSVWAVQKHENRQEEFRAVGSLDAALWGNPGDVVELTGVWVDDDRYGHQLRVESVRPYIPREATGLIRWLSEQPDIGERTAQRLVEALGATDDLMDRIKKDPSLVDQVPGLNIRQRLAIVRAAERYCSDRDRQQVLEWCYRYGFGPTQASTIYKVFGSSAPDVLSKNPWTLARVHGFGFLTADKLAQRLDVSPASMSRLRAALRFALEKAALDEGHVYLPKEAWGETAFELLRETAMKEGYGRGFGKQILDLLPTAQVEAVMNHDVVLEDDRVYLPALYEAEVTVRNWLTQRVKNGRGLLRPEDAEALAQREDVRGQLDDVQLSAVVMALSQGASVLTGGPGTGKTTVTRSVIQAIRLLCDDVPLLCAPTGRAAKRMADVTGVGAKTIHRLLEYHPDEGFRRNETRPLRGCYLIADEMSMTDVELFAALVKAIPEGMPVLFVGDVDQLPPVGPGAPFHEICGRRLLPTVRLERIYRQDAGGPIARAAQTINRGFVPPLSDVGTNYRVHVFERPSSRLPQAEREKKGRETRERMADAVLEAVRQLILAGWSPSDIQVLTPIKRGVLGTQELNERLRPILNAGGHSKGVFALRSGRQLWYGDRVVQTVNDYELTVFNGEIGYVVNTNIIVPTPDGTPQRGIVVEFEDGTGVRQIEYPLNKIRDLQLAYATTVHKAQGSEFPVVVLCLAWDAYMLLTRPLLYTAVSRAREVLWMIVEEGAVEKAVETVHDVRRNQHLEIVTTVVQSG